MKLSIRPAFQRLKANTCMRNAGIYPTQVLFAGPAVITRFVCGSRPAVFGCGRQGAHARFGRIARFEVDGLGKIGDRLLIRFEVHVGLAAVVVHQFMDDLRAALERTRRLLDDSVPILGIRGHLYE